MLALRWSMAAVLAGTLLAPLSQAAAPVYSLASIVNSATGVSGEFAPNSLVTIYGTGLAFGSAAAGAGPYLPRILAEVQVIVGGSPVDLFYVSPQQINFLMPSEFIPGPIKLFVARQGVYGPMLSLTLKETAPGFFPMEGGAVIATHADGRLINPESAAVPGEIVVLYAAGLGHTDPENEPGRAPNFAASIVLLNRLVLLLNGKAVTSSRILYAGTAPGFAGLYQINLRIPVDSDANPEIRVFIGAQGSPSFLKLLVRI